MIKNRLTIETFFCVFFFLSFSYCFSQATVHHWMLGANGNTTVLSNGYTINQSIGQQSVVNNGVVKEFVQQGFQQSYWSKIIKNDQQKSMVTAQVYPNPFKDFITIKFSQSPGKILECKVYDLQGRVVYSKNIENVNNMITIDLRLLVQSQFLIRVIGDQIIYSAKIIKN